MISFLLYAVLSVHAGPINIAKLPPALISSIPSRPAHTRAYLPSGGAYLRATRLLDQVLEASGRRAPAPAVAAPRTNADVEADFHRHAYWIAAAQADRRGKDRALVVEGRHDSEGYSFLIVDSPDQRTGTEVYVRFELADLVARGDEIEVAPNPNYPNYRAKFAPLVRLYPNTGVTTEQRRAVSRNLEIARQEAAVISKAEEIYRALAAP